MPNGNNGIPLDLCGACVYANYQCDVCLTPIRGTYYHCSRCSDGNFNICGTCFDAGVVCGQVIYYRKIPKFEPGSLPASRLVKLSSSSSDANTPSTSASTPNTEMEDDKDMAMLRRRVKSTILTEKPNVKWDDIAGLENAKEQLQEAIILPMRFPQLFTGRRKARKALLLYGPPGTGKSYLAKAIATEIDCTLFSVSSSDIFSKWEGESERSVVIVFCCAVTKQN